MRRTRAAGAGGAHALAAHEHILDDTHAIALREASRMCAAAYSCDQSMPGARCTHRGHERHGPEPAQRIHHFADAPSQVAEEIRLGIHSYL